MKKFKILKLLLFLILTSGVINASPITLDLMIGGGYTKGSTLLSSELFSIEFNSGANYEAKVQALFFGLGAEFYYSINSLKPDAFSLYPLKALDFSDKFTNYGVGVVFGGGGGTFSPYISLKYGKTKFTGDYKYAPDGKHVIGAGGVKLSLSHIGIWGEVKFMRMMDILKEWSDIFEDSGNFNTFSITVGVFLRIN